MREYAGKVRLQSIGMMDAIKAADLKVGDVLVWNFGETSEVVAIEVSSTGKTLNLTTSKNGKENHRTLRASTLVVVKELNPVIEESVAADNEEIRVEIKEDLKTGNISVDKAVGSFLATICELTDQKQAKAMEQEIDLLEKMIYGMTGESRYRLRDYQNTLKDYYCSICEIIEQGEKKAPAAVEKPMNAFEKWVRTFLEEKEIDLEYMLVVEHDIMHLMSINYLIEIMAKSSKSEQKTIKDTFVKIDFLDGAAMNYLQYLADAYVKTNY